MINICKIFRTNVPITLFIVLFGGVFCSANLSAQDVDSLWYDIDYIRLSDARLTSNNASGLRYLPVDNVSEAKLYVQKGNGDFINFYQSNNNIKLGTEIESYYRLNKTSVFFGKISYNYFDGRNMGGSFFTNPNYNPIDILELADNTRGTKKQELFHLIGGVGVDLNSKISIGGKVDYEVGNYSKQKDLRNINKLLNLEVTAGVTYRFTQTVELGVNYYFNRNVESLNFLMEGNTDKTYESLISIGNFIGKKEQFGESGYYTAKNKINPMVNKFHGASLQVYLAPSNQFSVFNNFSYRSRKGYFGVPATASIVLTEHNSDILAYCGMALLKGNNSLHRFKIDLGYEDLKNKENIFREETPLNGLSEIKYYGSSDILKKKELKLSAQYTGCFDVDNYNPKWEFEATTDYYRRMQTAIQYPFYRKQTLNSYSVNLRGRYNIRATPVDMYSISLSASYRAGDGTPMSDAFYIEPSGSQKDVYKTIDRYLYREFEYLTSRQITGGLNFRYSKKLIKDVRNYIQIDYYYTKAFNVKYIEGSFYNNLILTLGCLF